MAQSQLIVGKIYKGVIEEVTSGVRDYFLDEGVDEQVLQELKHVWENKLLQTKAVNTPDEKHIPVVREKTPSFVSNTTAATSTTTQLTSHVQATQLVPVQITVPAQQGNPSNPSKTIVVHVPVSAIQSGVAGQKLQQILSSASAAATFALPPEVASHFLQQQLNASLQAAGVTIPPTSGVVQYQTVSTNQTTTQPQTRTTQSGMAQLDGPSDCEASPSSCRPTGTKTRSVGAKAKKSRSKELGQSIPKQLPPCLSWQVPRSVADELLHRRLTQVDGVGDTSDEDDDDDDEEDDDEDDEANDLNEEDADQDGQDEEPLNSEDDVSDQDPEDLFETDNVVVCQYDKITRSRNKWKFHLKDGIMNLDGRDFVFQKANGDAEW